MASKVGLSRGAFNNKLNEVLTYRFTDAELNRVCLALIELREALGVVEAADFNDALKILAPKTV